MGDISLEQENQEVILSIMLGAGVGYTNPEAIKNLMKSYDKDGNYLDSVTGLAGLLVTDKNIAQKHKIISIPESSRGRNV